MIYELFETDKFQSWLKTHDPQEVVGDRGSGTNCPIKRYLSTLDNVWYVTGHTIYFDPKNHGAMKIAPQIVASFVDKLDKNGRTGDLVTAKEALDILEMVQSCV